MADPLRLDLWSFGTWCIEVDEQGLVLGKSMHNGNKIYVQIVAHQQQRLIDYRVGATTNALCSRIFARVMCGEEFGASSSQCMLLLVALRSNAMDDTRWASLQALHTVEVDLIKSLIESGYDHRNNPSLNSCNRDLD